MTNVTETLFQQVEEKMMVVLSALEASRKENADLKRAQEVTTEKLQKLVSLFDMIDNTMENAAVPVGKPVLMQG